MTYLAYSLQNLPLNSQSEIESKQEKSERLRHMLASTSAQLLPLPKNMRNYTYETSNRENIMYKNIVTVVTSIARDVTT